MYTYNAKIIRVLDGDTFEAEIDVGFNIIITDKLRLAEIDTPETWRPRNDAERAHGNEAKTFVEDLILNMYVVITTEKTGKYGRYIAYVRLPDGRDLTTLLVESGFEKRTLY